MLSTKLKELRAKRDMSQAALAEILGVTQQAVGRWEKELNMPDIEALNKIADYFHVTTDELLGRSVPKAIDLETARLALSSADREHIEKYRSLTPGHKDAVDGLLNTLYEQDRDAAAPATERAGFTAGEEDERAKLHRLLDEELDKEKEERRASSYGNSATGSK